jgi:hypothetical protein
MRTGSDAVAAAFADDIKTAQLILVLDEYEHLVAAGIHRQLDLLIQDWRGSADRQNDARGIDPAGAVLTESHQRVGSTSRVTARI